MRKASFAGMNCSVAQALEIVGEWWTLLILRDCFLGVRRFDDFVERLGISRNVLTNRLDTLVDAGVLVRRPYDEGRGRYDYLLTDKVLVWLAKVDHHLREIQTIVDTHAIQIDQLELYTTIQEKVDTITSSLVTNNYFQMTFGRRIDALLQQMEAMRERCLVS